MPDDANTDTSTNATQADDTDTDTPTETDDVDHRAEAEKWRALARKNEKRAETNAQAARELAALKQSTMSDQERLSAEAESRAAQKYGSRLVDAEVRAAAAGRDIDVKALLDGLDRARFLNDEAEPDSEAIAKWVDKIAPVRDTTRPTPRVPAGARGTSQPADMNTIIRRNLRGD